MTDNDVTMAGQISAIRAVLRLLVKECAERSDDPDLWLASCLEQAMTGLATVERNVGLDATSELFTDAAIDIYRDAFGPINKSGQV